MCDLKMTVREALKIQAGHLNHYGSRLTFDQEQELRKRIAAKTKADTMVQYTQDEPLPVRVINRLVPRGGAIEAEANRIRQEA